MSDMISRQSVSDLFDAWEAAELDHHIPKILRDMLKTIPSAHPEPCEDAVSRQAVINIINKPVIIKAKEQIEALPSEQLERKKGKWEIYVISMLDGEGCRCSECGFEGAPYWNYCPNCGADLRGD